MKQNKNGIEMEQKRIEIEKIQNEKGNTNEKQIEWKYSENKIEKRMGAKTVIEKGKQK